ncbi:MAG: FtsX-like permease family protein [Gammaproteobacteria bacterium]|nr:FtsX-like permease family protein [Gammaproteobacteria bacterium]
MTIVKLAWASLWNRRLTAFMTILAIALSVTMLLGVEKLRRDARANFANTISGTDLIVGARSGSVQLLLYSIFRIGNATANISWRSYEAIAAHKSVRWTVPISLGDSHRGFRVMGTTVDYFEYYRYASKRKLRFAAGQPFADLFDAVIGAEVAAKLGYRVGQAIVLAHGTGDVSFVDHADKPFKVASILARTGTPVDRTVHVSLQGIEAIHAGWAAGVPLPGRTVSPEQVRQMDLQPKAITAFLIGLETKMALFRLLRSINEYRAEPLLAIIPGVALQELWDVMAVAENALQMVSVTVVVTGLLGMLTVILASLEARRREMAVLRSVGARPAAIFFLFMSEAGLLALVGGGFGVVLLVTAGWVAAPIVESQFGLHVPLALPAATDWMVLAAVVLAALLAGMLPALRAYRLSLADGLTLRI